MRIRVTFLLLAATSFVVFFAQPSYVTSQQPPSPVRQAPPDESTASLEAKERLRKLAAQQKTYQVGYSPAMERKLTQLSGIEIPRGTVKQALQVKQEAKRRLAESIRRR